MSATSSSLVESQSDLFIRGVVNQLLLKMQIWGRVSARITHSSLILAQDVACKCCYEKHYHNHQSQNQYLKVLILLLLVSNYL